MKKITLFILLIVPLLCYGQTNNRMVYDISNNKNQLLEKNIIYYHMCKNWCLTANDINIIISHGEEENIPNDINIEYAYGFTSDGIFYNAKFKNNTKNYSIKLGSTSWFIITNEDTKEKKLYSCRDLSISKLFIGNFVTESIIEDNPDLENKYRTNYNQTIDSLSLEKVSSKWNGVYNLKIQNKNKTDHDFFQIKIDNNIQLSINGGIYTQLLFYEEKDTLYVYNNPYEQLCVYDKKTNRNIYIGRGGYFFKILKKNKQYLINSSVINDINQILND